MLPMLFFFLTLILWPVVPPVSFLCFMAMLWTMQPKESRS